MRDQQQDGKPDVDDIHSSGDERARDGDPLYEGSVGSRSSSPEPYLSDMDDEAEDPDRRVRVREGSEGYEIAPRRGWMDDFDRGARSSPAGRMPWEQEGRYNVYEPAHVYDTESGSDS